MNTQQALKLLNDLGLKCTVESIQNYRKGYWKDKDGNQHWYFPDHLRLPYEESIMGIGYTYSEEAVRMWAEVMLGTRGKTAS